MKTIKLNSLITSPKKGSKTGSKVYRVYCGSRQYLTFNNKKTAASFQNVLSKDINDFLRQANVILGDMYVLYRNIWPSLSKGSGAQLCNLFTDISDKFERIYATGSSYQFDMAGSIFETMKHIMALLEKYLTQKKRYTDLYVLLTKKSGLEASALKLMIHQSQLVT